MQISLVVESAGISRRPQATEEVLLQVLNHSAPSALIGLIDTGRPLSVPQLAIRYNTNNSDNLIIAIVQNKIQSLTHRVRKLLGSALKSCEPHG